MSVMIAEPAPGAMDLQLHRSEFLKRVEEQGYSAWALRQFERTADRFIVEAERLGLSQLVVTGQSVEGMSDEVLDSASEGTRRCAAHHRSRFIDYLVEVGVARRCVATPLPETPRERLRREYQAYLRLQRGVSDSTAYHCVRFCERFLSFRFGEGLGDLNQVTPDDVVAFLVELGERASRDKTPPTHLRSLFQFLFWSGKTVKNLADGVPRVARPQPQNLPRYLPPTEVQRLIDAVRTDDALGRRNYAMLLLMARLGLRATEVIAIRLDDIDWRAGEVLVRGKGKLHDRMPLPSEVGAGLADYLRNGRKGKSRVLFVSNRAPHTPFGDGQIVNDLLRRAFALTGLKPPQKYVGSHLLRHSLATGMLRGGASLDEIGDTLRHRSRVTTTIYAKLDLEGLRSVAQEWPESSGGRP
jgi:site-specific recombinase XerD